MDGSLKYLELLHYVRICSNNFLFFFPFIAKSSNDKFSDCFYERNAISSSNENANFFVLNIASM